MILEVKLIEGSLVLSASGEAGGSVLYPESEISFFFLDSEDLTTSFVVDKKGKAQKLILHEGGKETPAEKI